MKRIKLKKSFDLRINKRPSDIVKESDVSLTSAVMPDSIPFIKPKLTRKVSEKIAAGEVLYFDKSNPKIQFVSPVSGVIKDIEYGERRRLDAVVIEENDAPPKLFNKLNSSSISNLSKEALTSQLLDQGLWPFFRSFPFKNILWQ